MVTTLDRQVRGSSLKVGPIVFSLTKIHNNGLNIYLNIDTGDNIVEHR